MLKLSRSCLRQMLAQAKEHLPIEACGLLAGSITEDSLRIVEIFPMTNLDQSPEHFSMDPKEQFAAVREMRRKELKLLGNYHSHPGTPARPSAEDIRLAYDPEGIYMILSLQGEEPVIKAFQIRHGAYSEILLEIVD